jgi:GNAT superfamily N-acetyltransferase
MTDLPEALFANPAWHALKTKHCHFAISAGDACRYPADVAPFAAVAAPTMIALQQLHSLLLPRESVWLIGERYEHTPGLCFEGTLECLQMVLPREVPLPGGGERHRWAFPGKREGDDRPHKPRVPGFFRSRTWEMGSYYGVRSRGELVAMGGERLMLNGYPEISGVCTQPAHRGKGYASSVIWQLARNHRRDGVVSWLHVVATNHHAINLYFRMGFTVVRKVTFHRISRKD